MGTEFTFFDYTDSSGVNVIREWLHAQGARVEAKLDGWIKHLEATPPGSWSRPLVDTLTGECEGLIEIRAQVSKVQYRLLGFHGPTAREVTLVLGAAEKEGRWEPPSACQQALSKRNEVLADLTRRKKHGFG